MAQRPLLKPDRWIALIDVPSDEETLIRNYTLGQAELDLIQAKKAAHNRLGLAIQLCLMRLLGRSWRYDETLPIEIVEFVAAQIDGSSAVMAEYSRREQNRREHALEAQRHLGLRQADGHDLRAALTAAIGAADVMDQGADRRGNDRRAAWVQCAIAGNRNARPPRTCRPGHRTPAYGSCAARRPAGRAVIGPLALAALHSAIDNRKPPPGSIHQTDRGCQYAGESYRRASDAAGLQSFMSAVGNPFHDA